jgi:hypothetical protein
VRRKEDFRFLTGQGTYTDDIARPGPLHAFLLQYPRSRGARCYFNNRLVSNPMEPRAATGEFDRGSGEYTLYTTSQAPHVHRLLIAAFVLQLPEHKLRVVAPDWAVASAQRARSMPSRRSCSGLRESSAARSNGRRSAARSSSPITKRVAISPRRSSLSTRTANFLPCASPLCQSRRLSRQLRPGNPDLVLRHLARRQLRDPRDLC